MTARTRGYALAALLTAALVACFASGWLWNHRYAEFTVTLGWTLAVLGAFAGWGTLVARVFWPGRDVGLAMRSVWGASFLIFVGGVLAAMSLLGGAILIGFTVLGDVLLAHSWWRDAERLDEDLRVRLRAMRMNPALVCLVLFAVGALLVRFAGGIADFQSNPYDDDTAYHLFTRQLIERGTILDPFSFRRMSTLGGQSFCHAMLAVRVQMVHMNAFDRAMAIMMSAGLIASHRIDGRNKPPVIARVLSVLFLVSMPFTGINTASFYSGVAWFLAFYQTAEQLPGELATDARTALRRCMPLALVGAAACTLRQNYQTQVAFFILVTYVFAVLAARRRVPLKKLFIEPVLCLGLVGILVLPWLVLMYRSNDTFLFPIMQGTLRPGVNVQTTLFTPGKLLRFYIEIWLTPEPIFALPLIALAGISLRDRIAIRPMTSTWIATFLSVAAVIVGFTMADAGNIARYDYGFVMSAVLLTWQTSVQRATRGTLRWRAVVPMAILAFSLCYSLQENVNRSKKMWAGVVRDTEELLRRTIPPEREPPIASTYRRLQSSVPAGEPLLVLLDQAFYLDFRRNPILNLDMPGMASPYPGIPCFKGSEPVADYLQKLGIRYVAFVEEQHSTYLYKRDVWVENLYHYDQFWRIIAPYLIDVMDNLAELGKTRKHLAESDGMIVLDLQTRRAPP